MTRYAAAQRLYDTVKRPGHRVLTLPEIQRVIDADREATGVRMDGARSCWRRRLLWEPDPDHMLWHYVVLTEADPPTPPEPMTDAEADFLAWAGQEADDG